MPRDARRVLAWLGGAPRWLIALAIIGLAAIEPIAFPHADQRVFAKLEAIAYDARLRLTQPKTGDSQVVIIDIDERSLAHEGRWQWSRDKLARLTTLLLDRYGVRAVGFDVFFPERDPDNGISVLEDLATGSLRGDPEYLRLLPSLRLRLDFDAQLARAMSGRPVVLAFTFTDRQERVGALPPPVFGVKDLDGRPLKIAPARGYLGNLPLLQQAAAGGGHIDPLYDADNLVRRVPLVKRYGDDYYPALDVTLARIALDAKSAKPRLDSNGDLDAIDIGGLLVPVDDRGTALVPYRGAQRTFRYVSATDVLAQSVPADAFTGAIALIGTSAKGLNDLRPTPMDAEFPGVEIHANLLTGMLNGEVKSVPAGAQETEALIMLIAGSIAVFLVPWRRPLLCLLGTFAVALAVCTVNLWLWQHDNAVLPLAPTLVLLLALLLYNLLTGFVREARAIRQLSDMFGEYVPRERVARMRESGERFSMEGESRELTVLFSDVRDFTAISEKLPPRELAEMMNVYLTALTEVIHATHGTIDKYIGDAIMAFWGAPVPNPQHPRDAVEAAMRMQERMGALHDDFNRRGWPRLSIGIGINTGVMNVGDMGSRFRKAYTVLGDAVNLASRLEGLTKLYCVGTLIGQDTRRAAPDIICREVDRVRVKGRAAPLAIYQPLGTQLDPRGEARLASWNEALLLYRMRRFTDARTLFGELAAYPADARLCALFEARCAAYAEALLPSDWDGAMTFATK